MTGKQWALGLLSAALIGCGGYVGKAVIETRENVVAILQLQQLQANIQLDHEQRIRPLERGYIELDQRLRWLEAQKAKQP